jgi:uncharacterized protein
VSEALFAAVKSGDLDALNALLAGDPGLASAREDGISAVLVSLYHRQDAARAALLAAGAEIGPLEAAALGELDKLDPGARGADGFTALHLAAFFGQLETAAVLLEHGAAPDAVAGNGSSLRPLHSAAAGGHAAIVGLLLERGADPNARQQGGYVPLHSAAARGDEASVRLLLEHGADPDLRTDDGRRPRDLAAGDGRVAELLSA